MASGNVPGCHVNLWQTITWDTARTAGFVAYGLVTASVALGLVLSMRWRSQAWPRWATNDLHRYVTLLALTFTLVHGISIWLDPYMAFTPAEVLIPLVTRYRPIWVAPGIVSGYLMIAIYLSERIQKYIGFAWWRRLHYLTFGIYILATVHGVATGSDTRTGWAIALYAGSALLVGGLLSLRLLRPHASMQRHPRVAGMAVLTALALCGFTVLGPARPGWNSTANSFFGLGGHVAAAYGSAATHSALRVPFSARLSGTASLNRGGGFGAEVVRINGTLSGGADGGITLLVEGLPGPGGFDVRAARLEFTPRSGSGPYQGQLTAVDNSSLRMLCVGPQGDQIQLDVNMQIDDDGNVSGGVTAAAA